MAKESAADPSRFRQASQNTTGEVEYRKAMESYIQQSAGTHVEKIENFPKYISRQSMARYIALYEIFKLALDVQGDVIECGVNWGGCLMYFAQLSTVLEPINLQRRLIGFDTFSGFVSIAEQDKKATAISTQMKIGGLAADSYTDLLQSIELYNQNRFIGHVNKIELIKGNAIETIPRFLDKNPHTVVSLLHLDFDLYEPTKLAIEQFFPRMPKGGVIIFDELNNRTWPGETTAVLEHLGINNLRIKRFPFEPYISYAVLE